MEATPNEISWFMIYLAVLLSVIVLILLVFLLVLSAKIQKIVGRLDDLSQSAGNFVQMGMQYFRAPKKPK